MSRSALERAKKEAYRNRAKVKAREAAMVAPSPEIIKAQTDFAFFCEYVTRNSELPAKPARHHLEWHQHWITGKSNKALYNIAGVNVDLLSPRGSSKSTVLGLFLAWAIGNHAMVNRVLQILYCSANIKMAREKSATVKAIIESPEYREIFPMIRPGAKWADDYWAIDFSFAGIKSTGAERFTMMAAGVKGGITSKRFHLVVFDDLIKGVDDIATPDSRLKLEKLVSSSIRPTLIPGGRILSLGTRFRPDDIHVTQFTKAKRWTQIQESAILTDDEGNEYSYWQDWHSLEWLQEQRAADPLAFSYQYQNVIIPLEDIGLSQESIHLENIPTDFDSFVVGVDLAASLKQKADYTVLMLLGRVGDSYYFLDYRRGKWQSNLDILDALIGLYEEWNVTGVGFNVYVESIAYQASIQGDFNRYVVNEKGLYDMHCYPYKLRGDKLAHLLSISGIYASNKVIYNKYRFRRSDDVIKELTEFGTTAHDDCLDACAIALQAAGARRKLEGAS